LVETENEAERLMLALLRQHLSPDSAKSLTEEELAAAELVPFKTDDFRLFVHGNTVGVACLGYFSEGKHPYRWLMCLPAISAQVGRPLNRLFVTGVLPPSADDVIKASSDAEVLEVDVKINYLELPPEALDAFRSNLTQLMDAVVDETAPLMPVTFHKGIAQRFQGKPAKLSDDSLRSSENGPGDSDDARARILIPEQYAFPTMAEALTKLIPSDVRRLTTRDVPKYARLTLKQQLEELADAKREKDEKARRKAEKDAAKAAVAEAGEVAPKKSVKSKKKEDLS
jgi:hypothetical protein